MSNAPSAEGLSSPVGTSGSSEADDDDEDVALEADSNGRSASKTCLFSICCNKSQNIHSRLHLEAYSGFLA